jgi:two-component sensor histidine kinase/PAS domain-containing protein
MLSVGPHARRSSPPQDLPVKTRLPRLVGHIYYRQRILSWLRIRFAGRPTRALRQDRILEPPMPQVDPLDLVETIREGLLVLEPDLTIQFANRSFYRTFAVTPEDTVGRKLYELGDGQWDIPALRSLIETILPERATIEAFEVDHVFPSIGRRVMVLNARKVDHPGNHTKRILLAIEDVTERTRLEHERAAAHARIAALLQELGHRIKNSLQIIVSMVSLEARNHKIGDGKAALERVSHRIAALGRLYSILGEANSVEEIDAATYLEALCRDLIESVQKENGISIALRTDIESELLRADRAIPLGLIVNELVTNAVKYAFPDAARGTVVVTLKRIPGELRLTVSDDGKGVDPRRTDSGVGGRLVEAFTRQLGGQIERESGNKGTIVSLTLPSREPRTDLSA